MFTAHGHDQAHASSPHVNRMERRDG
jgi:hypothetical protein